MSRRERGPRKRVSRVDHVPAHLRALGGLEEGETVVVAVSGGRDSVALLHLVRFSPDLEDIRVVAAHFDHAMRPGSGEDAAWVADLCHAWGVSLEMERAAAPPASEGEARRLRYTFLDRVRRRVGARWVLTAHHAHDQAETVLFRALRGTGIGGLRGIRERRPGLLRPFLRVGGDAVAAYAENAGITWREDPTNRDPLARNVLRHEILPRVREAVASQAVEALVALGARAEEDEAAWASVLPTLLEPLDAREEGGRVSFDREAFLALPGPVRARALRFLAVPTGRVPGHAGTRRGVAFSSTGTSGGAVPLGGGLELRRELDRLVLGTPAEGREGEGLSIPGPEAGEGRVEVGGRSYGVVWGPGAPETPGVDAEWRAAFQARDLAFPLRVRGWEPGDRIRLAYGHKKLKKLFLEARVPGRERRRRPVVADARGRILWVPGLAKAVAATEAGELPHIEGEVNQAGREGGGGRPPTRDFHIGIRDAETE
ncbi:MAG: tRNA lysidine(34) synthetase TilS [Gemmatimonadota bacterium]